MNPESDDTTPPEPTFPFLVPDPETDEAEEDEEEGGSLWASRAELEHADGTGLDCYDPAWFDWEHALCVAEIEGLSGSFALISPTQLYNGDYVQATFVPGGFILEYREHWPSEKSPGFRHYRACKGDDDEGCDAEVDASRWVFDLAAAVDCFRCFLEYPTEFPDVPGEWVGVTEEFADLD